METLNLAELQDVHRHALSLEQELDKAHDTIDRLKSRARQYVDQMDEMIRFISQTMEFHSFILEHQWKANATDKDMVMAFLANRREH